MCQVSSRTTEEPKKGQTETHKFKPWLKPEWPRVTEEWSKKVNVHDCEVFKCERKWRKCRPMKMRNWPIDWLIDHLSTKKPTINLIHNVSKEEMPVETQEMTIRADMCRVFWASVIVKAWRSPDTDKTHQEAPIGKVAGPTTRTVAGVRTKAGSRSRRRSCFQEIKSAR